MDAFVINGKGRKKEKNTPTSQAMLAGPQLASPNEWAVDLFSYQMK